MFRTVYSAFDTIKSLIAGYRKDDCLNHAAIISFYAIFSTLPLAMLAVVLFAYFLGSSTELIERLREMLVTIAPEVAEDLFQIIRTSLKNTGRMGLISTGILLVIASLLVTAVEQALDKVFRTEKARNFFHSRIVAIGFTFVFILLFAMPGLLPIIQGAVSRYGLLDSSINLKLSGDALFFLVAFMAFLSTVIVIPNHKVYFRYAIVGATVFTVLTGVARLLFRMYIGASWDRYDLIYNSLSVLIFVMVWIYYMANIYLLCAELVARLQERRLMVRTVAP